MAILSDHSGRPQPICAHPDPAGGAESDAIVFSMVVHVERRLMWVSPGRPCESPYLEIDLREALSG